MAIKVSELEAKIREQAGELAICAIREAGLKDDIAQLQGELDRFTQAIPAQEVTDGEQRNPKRRNP